MTTADPLDANTMSEPRRAVVTGANSGFGFATALRLARDGYQVFAGVRDLAKADKLLAASESLSLDLVSLDVTSDSSVTEAFASIDEHGPIDVLVNNAGISGGGPFELTPDDENRLLFETNYFGALRCIRAVLPAMRARGGGSIVNITSLSALFAWPNQACYSASKSALEAFSGALAHEVRRFGVRVVTVQPGAIRTEIVTNSNERNHFDRTSPYINVMQRNGKLIAAGFRAGATPTDVADTVIAALDPSNSRVQHPVGDDALAIFNRRSGVSLDEFVALGNNASDDDYNDWFKVNFGIEL
jgi:NAD(P)-dependent dehydrogenase (short-subunit alcohol dehydrogenase family)